MMTSSNLNGQPPNASPYVHRPPPLHIQAPTLTRKGTLSRDYSIDIGGSGSGCY